jgi:hypothetical protein
MRALVEHGTNPLFGSFQGKLFGHLEHTEYRRARSPEDFQDIGRLRSKAYASRPVYEEAFDDILIDEIDHDSQAVSFAVHVDGDLLGSVRLHVVTPDHRVSPAVEMFPDVLHPMLDQGISFIDPSRFTVDLEYWDAITGLPHIILRPALIATHFFKADYCLSCVKREHAAFYRRTFKATQMAGPINPPGMNVEAVLFATPRSSIPDICRRYPCYHFIEREAAKLFAEPEQHLPWPLTVAPTAKYAVSNG